MIDEKRWQDLETKRRFEQWLAEDAERRWAAACDALIAAVDASINPPALSGYDLAMAGVATGTHGGRELWAMIATEEEREGYALKPCPWEGAGEYQHVVRLDNVDDIGILVKLPWGKSIPTAHGRARR